MTVLASGSKGNSTIVASTKTRVLVDAGLSCRELLRRMALAGEDPAALDAILITHEHIDHVAALPVIARRLNIPVFFTEPTHRAWVRMVTPRATMSYAQWLDHIQQEKEARATKAVADSSRLSSRSVQEGPFFEVSSNLSASTSAHEALRSDDPHATIELRLDPDEEDTEELCAAEAPAESQAEPQAGASKEKLPPAALPAVEYFRSGANFTIGDLDITPFTIPHDAVDPCGFVFQSRTEHVRMAIATDLGYMPPNVKAALRNLDVLLLESNHDLEMLRDGPYPWPVKQRVLSRVGHLSNHATAEFLQKDYDGAASTIVLGHLSESNNAPELARLCAEQALAQHPTLLGNRVLLAPQAAPLPAICL